MMTVTLPGLYGRVGAVLSALIVALSAVGLTIHKDVYAGVPRRDFYCYYTNLSNLVVLIYFGLAAPFLYARDALRPLIPVTEYCVTMSILLTHLVFHHLLFPGMKRAAARAESRSEWMIPAVASLFTHYVVPLLSIAYWVLCAPGKQTIPLWAAALWTLFPLVYAAVILIRSPRHANLIGTDSPYPYPFLDVRALGWRKVALNCAAILAVCIAGSGCVIVLFRLLFARFGAAHALVLI